MIKKYIKRIKLLFNSLCLSVYYLMLSCFSNRRLDNANKDFVVSMTTYGWRYNFVFLTIESIFSQTIRPSKIYLWIYEGDKTSSLSAWFLSKQCKRGLVIKYVKKNVRSYKKLSYIFSLEEINFKYVITADDDVFYPKNWLKGFIEHPKVDNSVLCYRGRVISFDNSTKMPISYKKWPLASKNNNDSNYILPTGVSGICYPLASLDNRISDFNSIQALCPYADDIWYKLITTANGFQSLILGNNVEHYPPVITSLTKGLEKLNVSGELNIKQFISSLKYFGLELDNFNNRSESL